MSEVVRRCHWHISTPGNKIAKEYKREDLVNRLYQWLRERATHCPPRKGEREPPRTTRTEVTVYEDQRTVLLAGTVAVAGLAAGLERCPLCGQPLAPAVGLKVPGAKAH